MPQIAATNYSDILEKDDITVSELREVRKTIFSAEEEKASFDRFVREAESSGRDKRTAAVCRWLEGRYSEAMEILGGIPSDPLGLYIAAEGLLASGKTDEAVEILKKSASKIADGHGYVLLARALRRKGDYEGARETVKEALKEVRNNPDLYAEMGILADIKADHDTSVQHYHKALELDPECVDALFRLGYLSDLHGDTEGALDFYRRCVRIKPVRKNALVNLGLLYEELRRQEEAVACFKLAIEQDPSDQRAALYLRDARASEDMYFDEEQQKRRERRNKILETPITDFELSVRSRNCLEKMNVRTLGDLTRISEQELLSFKNFGETSLAEIKRMMSSKNLVLGQALEEEGGGDSGHSMARERDERARLLSKPIEELNLSVRSRHCMNKIGVKTMGDLVRKTEKELLAVKNFGGTSLAEVKQKLALHGLTLADG